MSSRLPYVWDYNIDETQFREILAGCQTLGRLDRDWAAVRLLEYAPYKEIIRMVGFAALVQGWPGWRSKIRSESRKRGFDFLVEWLPEHHSELLEPKSGTHPCRRPSTYAIIKAASQTSQPTAMALNFHSPTKST